MQSNQTRVHTQALIYWKHFGKMKGVFNLLDFNVINDVIYCFALSGGIEGECLFLSVIQRLDFGHAFFNWNRICEKGLFNISEVQNFPKEGMNSFGFRFECSVLGYL